MSENNIKSEFSGFGPIPSSSTTFSQGIGMGGSFAPVWTTQPILPAPRQSTTQQGLNLNNGNVKAKIDLTDHSADSYLSDSTNCTWVESKIDTSTQKSTIYGFSGCESESFLLEADSTANTTILALYDSDNANFLQSKIDSTSEVSVRGYSNNEDQNFLLKSSSVDKETKLELFDSGSQEYLRARVNIDDQVSQINGYANNQSQGFEIISNGIENRSHIVIQSYDTEQIFIEVDSAGHAKVNGNSGASSQNFSLNADDENGKSVLQLFDSETQNSILLQEKANDTKIYMKSGEKYVLIDFPKNSSDEIINAYWQEIQICVDGVAKNMKVLGSEPYDIA